MATRADTLVRLVGTPSGARLERWAPEGGWVQAVDLGGAVEFPALAFLDPTRAVVVGSRSSGNEPVDVRVADLDAGAVIRPPVPMGRARLGPRVFAYMASRVIVLGGHEGFPKTEEPDLATAELVDLSTATIQEIDAPGRVGAAIGQLADGSVVVVGGGSGEGEQGALRSGERFDPTTEQWSVLSSLPFGRSYPGFAALPDGRALIVGGTTKDIEWPEEGIRDVLLYDPGLDTWYELPPLREAHMGAHVVALAGGVAVVGGLTRVGTPAETIDYIAIST